ncbi:unnamed protein product [Clavelina lepadiformis]|uniref:Uncharacterized protein n=1 Tax=Clavelina lepadiformis TaxID=159417 RepID=A0ABP0G7N7_CLALP
MACILIILNKEAIQNQWRNRDPQRPDEKWEKESDDSVHEVDDSVSDRNYRPEDSESDASESSDSQLNEIGGSIAPLIRINLHQTEEI